MTDPACSHIRFTAWAATWLAALLVTLNGFGHASGASDATKRRGPRQEQQTYVTPAVSGFVAGSGGHICGNPGTPLERTGCLYFQPRLSERFVEVEVADASGLPVPFYLAQEAGPVRDKDGIFLCGASEDPIEIAPGLQLLVVIQPVRQEPVCAGAGTTGTVRVTFMKKPS